MAVIVKIVMNAFLLAVVAIIPAYLAVLHQVKLLVNYSINVSVLIIKNVLQVSVTQPISVLQLVLKVLMDYSQTVVNALDHQNVCQKVAQLQHSNVNLHALTQVTLLLDNINMDVSVQTTVNANQTIVTVQTCAPLHAQPQIILDFTKQVVIVKPRQTASQAYAKWLITLVNHHTIVLQILFSVGRILEPAVQDIVVLLKSVYLIA